MWRASHADRDRLAQALHWMAHAGLACSADNIDWMLTTAACGHLKAVRLFHKTQKVFDPCTGKDLPAEKKTKLQLMFHMHLNGWHLQIHSQQPRKHRRPPPFTGSTDEQKVYWVHEVSRALHREYLLCLLKATEIEGGVPHLMSKGAYCNLLEGKAVRTRRKPEAFATLEVGQAVHVALPSLQPRQLAGGKRQHPPQPCRSQNGVGARGSPHGSGSSGSSSASDSQSESSHQKKNAHTDSSPGAVVEDMPQTQTAALTTEVKSQLNSSVPTTEPEEAKLVDLPPLVDRIQYVESRAGGLVDRCGHDGCYEEANVACPACTVMLCDYHNGLFGPQNFTSRCHEHNPGVFARLVCPCQECKPTAVTQPVSAIDNDTSQAKQQSHISSSSGSPSSSSSTSSSSSSSSTDSGPGSGSEHAESSSSNRSADRTGHSPQAEPHAEVPEEHAARGVLLETTSFWKTCRFTVVKDKGLEVGLEVTCRDPRHHQKGLPPCRRTLRFAKYGGAARVQQVLKWWLLQSHHYGNRQAHVLQCPKEPEVLPTSEQLEAEQLSYLQPQTQPQQGDAEAVPDREEDTPPAHRPKRRRRH